MTTSLRLVIGASAFAVLTISLVQIAVAPDAPKRVYIPSEELTGRAADHDVVHALQDIVESGPAVGASVFTAARPVIASTDRRVPTDALALEASFLLRGLGSSSLTELEQLALRRGWEMAETPEAQADAVLRLRAAVTPD